MATFEFVCPQGHVTEIQRPIGDEVPGRIDCGFIGPPAERDGATSVPVCGLTAERQYAPPAIKGDRVLHHGRPRSAS